MPAAKARSEVLPIAGLMGLLLACVLPLPGCASSGDATGFALIPRGDRKSMVLSSNLSFTRYRYREQREHAGPEEGWQDVGGEGTANIDVFSNVRYEIEARADGYETQRIKLTEPDKRQEFIFLGERKSGLVVVAERTGPPGGTLGPVKKRMAVVIGISRYKEHGKWSLANLSYAAKDADALAKYLQDPGAGGFDEVTLLTDEQATTKRIKEAVRESLRGVQEEDQVLIYWSGHGSPDPHDARSLYLITYDTDPEHMASTSYAMGEFQADIAALRARRLLVLADTCHSGGISDPKIGLRGSQDNKIVDGLLRGTYLPGDANRASPLARNSPVNLIFTSCEQGEVSREDAVLGHGVFTYYLLKAFRGEADKKENGGDEDGEVTLGEAIEYTRDQVKRFTGNQQHPATAGQFDRTLPIGPRK